MFDALGAEYGALESDLALRWAPLERVPGQALEPADAGKVLALLLTLPHGVLKYSHTVPGAHSNSQHMANPPCHGSPTAPLGLHEAQLRQHSVHVLA